MERLYYFEAEKSPIDNESFCTHVTKWGKRYAVTDHISWGESVSRIFDSEKNYLYTEHRVEGKLVKAYKEYFPNFQTESILKSISRYDEKRSKTAKNAWETRRKNRPVIASSDNNFDFSELGS